MGTLAGEFAMSRLAVCRFDWQHGVKIPTTEEVVTHVGELGRQDGLRGCVTVQPSSALTWRNALDEPLKMVTFDKRLWQAAIDPGLDVIPTDFASFLISEPLFLFD